MTLARTLPPYAATLGIVPADDATSLLTMAPADPLMGRPGFIHGGALAALLEMTAIAAAEHAIDDRDVRVGVVTMTVDYLRGAQLVETHADGRIVRIGRRIAAVEVHAWQEDRDRPIASARVNLSIDRS